MKGANPAGSQRVPFLATQVGQTVVWQGRQIQQYRESACLNTALKVLKWVGVAIAVTALVAVTVLALYSPHVLGVALIVALAAAVVLGGGGFIAITMREHKWEREPEKLIATLMKDMQEYCSEEPNKGWFNNAGVAYEKDANFREMYQHALLEKLITLPEKEGQQLWATLSEHLFDFYEEYQEPVVLGRGKIVQRSGL